MKPKMKLLIINYLLTLMSPPSLYVFLSWNIYSKSRYFEECWEPKFSVPIDFHYMDKKIQWKSMGTKTVWLPTFFKNICFCVPRKKKVITVLEQHESEEMMTKISF